MSTTNETKRIASTELQALLDKATPGDWDDNGNGIILGDLDHYTDHAPVVAIVEGYDGAGDAESEQATANAEILALSRTLAEEVLELRGMLNKLEDDAQDVVNFNDPDQREALGKTCDEARAILSKINPS